MTRERRRAWIVGTIAILVSFVVFLVPLQARHDAVDRGWATQVARQHTTVGRELDRRWRQRCGQRLLRVIPAAVTHDRHVV